MQGDDHIGHSNTMSSATSLTGSSTQKRKHEEDAHGSKRKKRRSSFTEDSGRQTIDELKASKKEKAKKDKSQDSALNGDSQEDPTSPALQIRSVTTKSPAKKTKAKEKREVRTVTADSPNRDLAVAASSQTDEEMHDALTSQESRPETEAQAVNGLQGIRDTEQLQSSSKSSFQTMRVSLYLPIPAVASSNPLSALLTVHLSPLLLTFFPPVAGVILAYQDPVLSGRPQPGAAKPYLPPSGDLTSQDAEAFSQVAEEFGASWVWLTVTLLVFKPQPGDELSGWINVMSEGFIGLVSYNYFQTSVSRNRIPRQWTWTGPSRHSSTHKKSIRKGKLNDSDGISQEILDDSQDIEHIRDDAAIDGIAGSFVDEQNTQVSDTLKFRVVDLEMIQAQERGRQYALQLEGTLLDKTEEQQVREEERLKWENRKIKHNSRSQASATGTPLMSGGLATHSRAGSVVSLT